MNDKYVDELNKIHHVFTLKNFLDEMVEKGYESFKRRPQKDGDVFFFLSK